MLSGLAASLVVGAGLIYLVRSSGRAELERWRDERQAVATLGALTDLVEAAQGDDEIIRQAVTRFQESVPAIESIRVVRIRGTSLVASSAPLDEGDRAPPRRLEREEKPLFDQARRLKGAVATNREEEAPRDQEIEIEPKESGGFSVAGPLEEDGTVAGLVSIEAVARPAASRPSTLFLLLTILIPLLLFLLPAFTLGERRLPLFLAALVLAIAALWTYSGQSASSLDRERMASDREVATTVADAARQLSSIRLGLGLEAAPGLRPGDWDADPFRRPLGYLSSSGELEEATIRESMDSGRAFFWRVILGIGILSLLLLAAVGLGPVERLVSTLVTYRQAASYVLPAMLGMLVLVFLPFFFGIMLSFTDSNIYNTGAPITETWLGLGNFKQILGDFGIAKRTPDGLVFDYHNFYWTLFFTIVWTITNVTIGVSVGLALALILNSRGLKLRPIYRVLLILPWAVPNYITALIWRGMFHKQFGVINQVIQMFGGEPISWYETPFTSFLAVLATNGWLSFPFMMVVSLGALQSIPADLYEAARVDGASRRQQFRFITLPSLKPALVPAIILSVIWTFNQFNIIYLVSQGEPGGSTEILITESYKLAFEQYRYGYAAAYSTVIFLILLAYGIWQNRVTRATEGI
jgi:arabinogalactan oligomer/maltooligosaccharide transport system permease protein